MLFALLSREIRGTGLTIQSFLGRYTRLVALKGANVEDEKGKSYPVKTVLPVPAGSHDVDLGIESGPGAGRRIRQREML